ncbi:signal peptidase I [Alkaliphilus hydrothermalis]|uniref:Signal peptidase I n=1 Tax=Alkaliphilus hydrothermalis TaxID=1482730 RepID=A0ABS2NNB3_9FIRM|nr:signal peptidase I [Alkaliphilus hydrothermalis]MBM7614437.1 signal peptidase I [Alkaliphilus hydrothermalis]
MRKEEILEWVKTILLSVVIALVITTFVKPTIVRQHSMMPTLSENDFLIINRLLYKQNPPKQGDIVVFKSDIKTNLGRNKLLIKRVIALPGDTLLIKEGDVYVNGEVLTEDYTADKYTEGKYYEGTELTIPEGKIFAMGDNRFNSMDSRDEVIGLIDIDAIVGRAFLRLYPLNKIGLLK